MSAELLRRAAVELRRDAAMFDNRDSDFCEAVAGWLEQTAAIREEAATGPLAMAMRAISEPADLVARAYLGEPA